MKHKTLWFVIVWLAILAALFVLQAFLPEASIPLAVATDVAGAVSFAYVGIDKTRSVVAAAQSPRGEYGQPYVPPMQDKHLWIVIAWLIFCVLAFIVQALLPDESAQIPISQVVGIAGILTAAYVGLDKGTKLAAATGAAQAGETGQ